MSDDATLGGYAEVHARPPAFAGADGRSYTADTLVDDEPDEAGRYGAALLFVRWSEGGERPDGHLETEYLAFAATPDDARAAVHRLTLHDVKRHLDRRLAETRSDA